MSQHEGCCSKEKDKYPQSAFKNVLKPDLMSISNVNETQKIKTFFFAKNMNRLYRVCFQYKYEESLLFKIKTCFCIMLDANIGSIR